MHVFTAPFTPVINKCCVSCCVDPVHLIRCICFLRIWMFFRSDHSASQSAYRYGFADPIVSPLQCILGAFTFCINMIFFLIQIRHPLTVYMLIPGVNGACVCMVIMYVCMCVFRRGRGNEMHAL